MNRTVKFLRFTFISGFVYLSLGMNMACSKSSKKENESTPRTDITADLSGSTWFGIDEANMDPALNYTVSVYDASTGVWFNGAQDPWSLQPRPGNGISFSAKGDFEICSFTSSGVGGLRSYTFFYMKGTAEQKGNEITLHPNVYRNMYHSVGNPGLDYDKELEKEVTKLTYSVHHYTDGWDHVDITWKDGTVSRFYRHS